MGCSLVFVLEHEQRCWYYKIRLFYLSKVLGSEVKSGCEGIFNHTSSRFSPWNDTILILSERVLEPLQALTTPKWPDV